MAREMKSPEQDFLSKEFGSTGEMFAYLTYAYGESPATRLHAFILHPIDDASVERIHEVAEHRSLIFEPEYVCPSVYRITLGVNIRKVQGFLVIHEDWWMFLVGGNGFRASQILIESFVKNHFFPVIHPAYIEANDLVEISSNLSEVYDEIILEEFSMASERSKRRVWMKSKEKFTLNLARSLQEKNDASFTGLKLSAHSLEEKPSKIKIYSKSRLCFLSGSFGDFYQFVIIPFVRRSLQANERYTNLERTMEDGALKLHGIRIKGNRKFTNSDMAAAKKYIQKEYSTSLIYENPVIILQASDERDGSSFDVYITESEIDIIPLSKSSSGSLIELCNSIVRLLPPFVNFSLRPTIQITEI